MNWRLLGHVAQARAARILSAAFWIAAAVAFVAKGPAPALALALAALAARGAVPPPDPELDRLTGRR